MLIILILLYIIPVYLCFFRWRVLALSPLWKLLIPLPPLLGLAFLWFAFGRYVPMVGNAYMQAPVLQVASEVGGFVVQVHVEDNQRVAAGAPLFQIDSRPLQYQRDLAQAKLQETQQVAVGYFTSLTSAEEQLNLATAQREAAKAQVNVLAGGIEVAKQSVLRAEAQLRFDEGVYRRNLELIKTNSISTQDFDNSERQWTLSQVALTQAKQSEIQASASLNAGTAQLASAEAAVQSADASRLKANVYLDPVGVVREGIEKRKVELQFLRAEQATAENAARIQLLESWLEASSTINESAVNLQQSLDKDFAVLQQVRQSVLQAEYQLARSTVYAPTDGTVSNLKLLPNSFVTPGVPVISFIDTQRWRMVAAIPENLLARVRPDDEVMVTLRNYPLRILRGKVSSVGMGVIQGQGVPSGTLADTDPRRTRQADTPQAGQEFQVIVDLGEVSSDTLLRVGQTGRATIFASGGMPGLNQLGTVIHYLLSATDYLYPQPGLLLVAGLALVLVAFFGWWRGVGRSVPA